MGYILFYLAIIPFGVIWTGYVQTILWAWFIVPLGAPAVSLFHAAGINMLLSLSLGFRGLEVKTEDKRGKPEKAVSWLLIVIVLPAAALLAGWLYRLGM